MREVIDGTDLLVVRELTGGIYFGAKTRTRRLTRRTSARYTTAEIERIARIALPRRCAKRVTSVDKANVLESSRLWRDKSIAIEVGADFPDVKLEHHLVDSREPR